MSCNRNRKIIFSYLIIAIVLLIAASSFAEEQKDATEMPMLYYTNDDIDYWVYGDYMFSLENGQAIIESVNGAAGGPGWDEQEYSDEMLLNRPGKSDKVATYPEPTVYGKQVLVIPSSLGGYPVVSIGYDAFVETGFDDIVIPEGIVSIEKYAFSLCYYTDTITIPESVTFISEDAFYFAGVEAIHGLMLRVTKGSYAEQYAEDNGIAYVILE